MPYYDDWDTNPDANTAPAPAGAPTGVYPGTGVAQTFRRVMAAIKQLSQAAATLAGANFTGGVTIGTTDTNANLTVNGITTVDGALNVTGGDAWVGTSTENHNLGVNGSASISGGLVAGSLASGAGIAASGSILADRATGRSVGVSGGPYITLTNGSNGSCALLLRSDGWKWGFDGSNGNYVYYNSSGTPLAYFTAGGDIVTSATGSHQTAIANALARANQAATAIQCTPYGIYEVGPIGEGSYMGVGSTDARWMRDIRITTTSDTTTYYAIIGGIQKPAV